MIRTRSLVLGLLAAAGLSAQQPTRRSPPPAPARRQPAPAPTSTKTDSTRADSTSRDSAATTPAGRPDSAAAAVFASILGTVFDSVHMAPLAQATVFLEGGSRAGRTTDRGVFILDSIPPGQYRVRVDHVLLDSIGVSMLTQAFDLAEGDSKTIELAIPSSATLVALSCPAARRALGPSALIGRLLDADTDEPVKGANVSIAWEEMSLNAGLRKVPRVRSALSGDDGVFRICGMPAQVEGTLQAMNKGVTTAEVKVKFEGQPLVIQGLKIGNANTVAVSTGDSAKARQREAAIGRSFSAATLQRGSATLTGRVVNAAGSPVVGARIDVVGTIGVTQSGAGGEFRIDSLPSGTQTVVVRQIGFAPEEKAVELSTRGPARLTVTMARAAQVLAPVRVTADAATAGLEKVGYISRKRSGMGYYLSGDEIEKRAPSLLTDVFRTIPGLRVVPSGTDYVVESTRNALGGCVRYWVDGAVWEAIFPGDVDRLVPTWEIAAMEVYNGTTVPAQFQMAGSSSCAAIVIWTRTRVNAPRDRR